MGCSQQWGQGQEGGGSPAGFRGGPLHSILEEQQHPQEEAPGCGGAQQREGSVCTQALHVPAGGRRPLSAPLSRCCKPSIPGNPRPHGDQSACQRTWVLFKPPDTQHPPGLRTVLLARLPPAGTHQLQAALETQRHPANLDLLPAWPVPSLPLPSMKVSWAGATRLSFPWGPSTTRANGITEQPSLRSHWMHFSSSQP